MNTIRNYVETFHLLFLDHLSRNIDNTLYAVKGGCNLRFFFNSMRYSEDLDLDVHTIARETLKKKVDRILNGVPFKQILKSKAIVINSISLPKQTDTTQRWKLTLQTPAPLLLNTKIEFSRRQMPVGSLYEPVNSPLVQAYNLAPIFCTHYSKPLALIQKTEALAGRQQTQARDVFDLFLLGHVSDGVKNKSTLNNDLISLAQNNALAITFDMFTSQVIAFLQADYQSQYNPSCWNSRIADSLFGYNIIDSIDSIESI